LVFRRRIARIRLGVGAHLLFDAKHRVALVANLVIGDAGLLALGKDSAFIRRPLIAVTILPALLLQTTGVNGGVREFFELLHHFLVLVVLEYRGISCHATFQDSSSLPIS